MVGTTYKNKQLEYYLATKKNDVLIRTITWKSLESIILNQKSQSHMHDSIYMKCNSIEIESGLGLGVGKNGK